MYAGACEDAPVLLGMPPKRQRCCQLPAGRRGVGRLRLPTQGHRFGPARASESGTSGQASPPWILHTLLDGSARYVFDVDTPPHGGPLLSSISPADERDSPARSCHARSRTTLKVRRARDVHHPPGPSLDSLRTRSGSARVKFRMDHLLLNHIREAGATAWQELRTSPTRRIRERAIACV